ncbi:hypothetical protein [Acinetobacter soli]|uniref:hypothetical protein n=1 Tax=Acinetobacter soli TaxID=487316 RepID=UPI002FEF5B44
MTDKNLTEAELSNITLPALVRLLQIEGYDLDKILSEYKDKVLGNLLSGSSPQLKYQTIAHLEEIISATKSDDLLKK